MENRNLVMHIDYENGIKVIPLSGESVKKSISISTDGAKFLDSLGADVILHFDENDKLASIELMGL